jgi:hypothetical protein
MNSMSHFRESHITDQQLQLIFTDNLSNVPPICEICIVKYCGDTAYIQSHCKFLYTHASVAASTATGIKYGILGRI